MDDKITMGKYRRLGKNTFLVFVGNAGSKLIGLLMLPFYTRWFSVEDYGTTDIINVYASLLMGLATACMAEAIFVFPKDQSLEKQKSYFSSGLLFTVCSLIGTAILFKIVESIFAYRGISNSFTHNVWLIYGLLVTNFLQKYVQQFVRSIDKIRIYAVTGIIVTVSAAICSFFVIPRWGVFGYVMALIFANLVGTTYSFLHSYAYRYVSVVAIRKNTCKEMLKYSVPLIPTNITWWLIGSLNRPLLERYTGLTAIGFLAVANKLPAMMNTVFSVFQQAWTISVLENFFAHDYNIFYNKIIRLVFFIQIFILCLVCVFSQLFVIIFTTPDFYEAWKYIPLLTIGVIFSNMSALVGSNFSATKESKYYFLSCVWGGLVSIIFNFLFIPRIGIWGACIAIVLSHIVAATTRVIYSWKYNKIRNIPFYIVIFSLGMTAIFVSFFIELLILRIMIFIIIIFLILFLNRKELKLIIYQIKRETLSR